MLRILNQYPIWEPQSEEEIGVMADPEVKHGHKDIPHPEDVLGRPLVSLTLCMPEMTIRQGYGTSSGFTEFS